MRILHLMVRPIRHYADFEGQSSLKEFWLFTLFSGLLGIPIAIGDALVGSSSPVAEPVSFAATLLLWFPNCALAVRRLHSQGLSGLWLFTAFGFVLLALLANALFGQFGVGRYATSAMTIAAVANLFGALGIIALFPASVADD